VESFAPQCDTDFEQSAVAAGRAARCWTSQVCHCRTI